MPVLTLIRGLPGSGKTTFARYLATGSRMLIIAADDFFVDADTGNYGFNPERLGSAHHWCQQEVLKALKAGRDVCVNNTFSRRWEVEPYIKIAKDAHARLHVLDLFDGGHALALGTRLVQRKPEPLKRTASRLANGERLPCVAILTHVAVGGGCLLVPILEIPICWTVKCPTGILLRDCMGGRL